MKDNNLEFDLAILGCYIYLGYLYSTIKSAEEYIKKIKL